MSRLVFFGKLLINLSAVFAIIVGLYVLLAPVYVQSSTASTISGVPTTVEEHTFQQSLFQTQGIWGVFVLVIFAGLYCLGVYLAYVETFTLLGLLSFGLLLLSYLAGFSIGFLYLPAAISLLIGTAIIVLSKFFHPGPPKSST